jgi:predicted permease
VAVISHAYWKTRFASDPDIVGKAVAINTHPVTIIGVAQEGFDGLTLGTASQVFVPLSMRELLPTAEALTDRRLRWLNVFGRLRPGITAEEAQTRLQPFYASQLQLEVAEPAFARAAAQTKAAFLRGTAVVTPAGFGKSRMRTTLTRPLWILMTIVACVLVISCANVANLLLARSSARQREIALRLALGATRWRIVRQLLIESLVLACIGGVGGLAIAIWGSGVLLEFFRDPEIVTTISPSPDLRILAFNLALSVLTGVLFGLMPARQSTRFALAPTLKNEAGSVIGGGSGSARLRKVLVAAQVALSLLLLIGAGLFVRSLRNLLALDPGFKTANLVSFSIDPRLNGYPPLRTKTIYKTLLQRLDATPGVESASLAVVAVLDGDQWVSSIEVEGHRPKPGENDNSYTNIVSPNHFKTMGIPLIAGRDFRDTDERTRPPEQQDKRLQVDGFRVAIVNERFARFYFGDRNPIGQHVGWKLGANSPTPMEIVGVVKDTKYTGLRDDAPRQVYFPVLEYDRPGNVTAYVRTTNPPETMFNLVRQTMAQIDPNLPIFAMRTLDDQLNRSLANERLMASLSGIFSALATLLAMIGLYGVMAYSVSRRTREIGVRMALGAVSGNIAWLVMREVLVLVAIGVVIARPIVWAASSYVGSQLYGIAAADAGTFVIASIGLAAVAALAGLGPALRAARVTPITALRHE